MKKRAAYRWSRGLICGALALAALPLAASAPDVSLRPKERPFAVRFTSGGSPQAPAKVSVRPQLRPGTAVVVENLPATRASGSGSAASLALSSVPQGASFAPLQSLRPDLRPKGLGESLQAIEAGLFGRKPPRKGSVCGDRNIRGEPVGRVPGRINGCGVKDAVRVNEVSGVRLSTAAVMDCDTARALKTWVEKGLRPAFRSRGPVVEMKVASHYSCRTRNNQPGGRISEHGKGKAIDLSAFTMMDGEVVTVLKGWGQGTTRRPLHKALSRACGIFGTVLGPEADRFHRDHFHFDTARHRGGPYCR